MKLGTSSSIIHVDAVDFEDAIRTHGIPYFMKIDIEGSDHTCLDVFEQFRRTPDLLID